MKPKYIIYDGPPKPPVITKERIDEIRAGQKAVDALPYGTQNLRAAEVEAQAIAEFRAKRDAQRAAEATPEKQD